MENTTDQTEKMEEEKKRKDKTRRLYYLLALLVGCVLLVLALRAKGFPEENMFIAWIQTFSDAFFASGIALFACWLIAWSWYQGMLDIFLYSSSLIFWAFQKEPDENTKERRDFAAYREHKKTERRSPAHLLLISGIFLGVSVILYLIVYIC